jgi:hypothetical protein
MLSMIPLISKVCDKISINNCRKLCSLVASVTMGGEIIAMCWSIQREADHFVGAQKVQTKRSYQ